MLRLSMETEKKNALFICLAYAQAQAIVIPQSSQLDTYPTLSTTCSECRLAPTTTISRTRTTVS